MRSTIIITLAAFLWLTHAVSEARQEKSKIIRLRQSLNEGKPDAVGSDYGGKCGLSLLFQLHEGHDDLPPADKLKAEAILGPTLMQLDTIIGKFHIHFDSSGENAPALLDAGLQRIEGSWPQYIDSLGIYLNLTWERFVTSFGYDPPPFQAGSDYYNIYVEELYTPLNPLYGETIFQGSDLYQNYTPPRYTSYIRIDNDFKDLVSEGIPGLKVTCAHELHHAFQLGSYGYRPGDIFFYELTSTWMEELLFPDVNDYFQYLRTAGGYPKGQFLYPEVSFTSPSWTVSYSRGIWGKYIQKKYSPDVMLSAWRWFRQLEALFAMDRALAEVGSSFRRDFLEWTLWNNSTGADCDTASFYDDGKYFPEIKTNPPIEYLKEARSFSDTIENISSVYQPICLLNSLSDNCNTSPQMTAIVSNLKMNGPSGSRYGFAYDLSPSGGGDFKRLSNGIYVRLRVSEIGDWISQETVPDLVDEIKLFPNPFRPRELKPLTFKLPPTSGERAELSIFTSSMDKIIGLEMSVSNQNFEPYIVWDGHDQRGEIAATGIYFYLVRINEKEYLGKFAIIRDK